VTNLGDEAYVCWGGSGGWLATVVWLQRNRYFGLTIGNVASSPAQAKSSTVKVARELSSRI
jgi:hypothetical protein